jgi:hypothetical protein
MIKSLRVHNEAPRSVLAELRTWQARRWWFAAATAAATIIVAGIPTVLIPNPWFTRELPVTAWAWPVLIATSMLAGLVAATYVARKDVTGNNRGGVIGTTGAVLGFFAIGCAVCNKLVLLALGYAGALQFFEPAQPYLAGGSIILLALALVLRIRRERSCPIPTSAELLTAPTDREHAEEHA